MKIDERQFTRILLEMRHYLDEEDVLYIENMKHELDNYRRVVDGIVKEVLNLKKDDK